MICDKCGQAHTHGKVYIFHYGKYLGSQAGSGLVKQDSSYAIIGQKAAWVCDRCRWKGVLRTGQVISFFVFFFLAVLAGPKEANWAETILMGIGSGLFVMLVIGTSIFTSWTWLTEAGARQAIKAHIVQLKASGNDAFFTESQMHNLQSRR